MRGSLWQASAQSAAADPAGSNAVGLWQPPGAAAASVTKPTMMPSKTRSKLKAEIEQLKDELGQVRTRLAETEKSQKAFSEQIKVLQAQLASKNVQAKPAEAIPKAPASPSPAFPVPAPVPAPVPVVPPVPAQQPAALPAVANSCAKKRKRDMEFKSIDWNTTAMPADNARDGARFPVAYDADLVESAPVPGPYASQDHFPKGEPLDWSRITAFAISRIFEGASYPSTEDIVYKLRKGELKCVSMIQIRPQLKDKSLGRVIERSRFRLYPSDHVRLAESITMIGIPLPKEQACERCKNSEGPFQFCTVLRGHGKGSCNNCVHDEEGNYCTFRDDDFRRGRPNWIPDPIEAP